MTRERPGAARSAIAGVALAWLATAAPLATSAGAVCTRCESSPACQAQCTSSPIDDDIVKFAQMFCEPLGCTGLLPSGAATCGEGVWATCDTPLEACCLPNGNGCLDISLSNCASAGGVPAGPGSSCTTGANPCLPSAPAPALSASGLSIGVLALAAIGALALVRRSAAHSR